MIHVRHGRHCWATETVAVVRAAVFVMACVGLAVSGCSSKKAQGAGPGTTPANIGKEKGIGETSLQQLQSGTLGGGGQQGPLHDIHFGFNDYTIDPQDGSVLKSNADWLMAHPKARVQVEGHCDERGSEDYNIALGAKRAQAAKDYLVTLGIPDSRISTISYGKELPICSEHEETCWAQNRRDHFFVTTP